MTKQIENINNAEWSDIINEPALAKFCADNGIEEYKGEFPVQFNEAKLSEIKNINQFLNKNFNIKLYVSFLIHQVLSSLQKV